MWWREGRRSENIEDRRGISSLPRGVRVGGAGGLGVLVLVVLAMFLGSTHERYCRKGRLSTRPMCRSHQAMTQVALSDHDELRDFVAVVLGDTEDTWQEVFRGAGRTYGLRTWYSSRGRSSQGVASRGRLSGHFTAPSTGRSIWI